ncbi:MAG TPA: cupin domain-containing protein [Haliangium sp.]|nr:cupin domain-containing protein [Haliangium sp.]
MSKSSGAQFFSWNDLPREQVTDMIERNMFTSSNMTLSQAILQEGCVVPKHAHGYEQATYVIEGALRFRIGEGGAEEIDVCAGEVLVIPPDVAHEVLALSKTLLLDIFSPPRQDWLEGRDPAFGTRR